MASSSAPVEETICFSSTSTFGRSTWVEPVAMMTFLAWTVWALPLPSVTVTSPLVAVSAPQPFSQSTLFFLKRNSTPLTLASTTLSLWLIRPFISSETLPVLTPKSPRWCSASSYFSEACSSALEGMQPMLRQVPPSVPRFSTQAVFRPSCAARIAAT